MRIYETDGEIVIDGEGALLYTESPVQSFSNRSLTIRNLRIERRRYPGPSYYIADPSLNDSLYSTSDDVHHYRERGGITASGRVWYNSREEVENQPQYYTQFWDELQVLPGGDLNPYLGISFPTLEPDWDEEENH